MLAVSLTTTRQRLSYCRATLISLAHQTLSPDKILLWVSRDSYLRDSGIPSEKVLLDELAPLPDSVIGLLDIRWVENWGPYRKLIPALRCIAPDDVLVTADDDIFYGKLWLETLVKDFDPSKKVVFAARARLERLNYFRRLKSYSHWDLIRKDLVLSDGYVVTFGGGVVLCPGFIDQTDLFDNSFLVVAKTADDLWYTKLLKRSNVQVQVKSAALFELNFMFHNDGLDNYNSNKSNVAIIRVWRKLVSIFGGYIGVSISNNDVVYKNLDKYFQDRN